MNQEQTLFETISDYGQKNLKILSCLTSCQANNVNQLIYPTQNIRIFSIVSLVMNSVIEIWWHQIMVVVFGNRCQHLNSGYYCWQRSQIRHQKLMSIFLSPTSILGTKINKHQNCSKQILHVFQNWVGWTKSFFRSYDVSNTEIWNQEKPCIRC